MNIDDTLNSITYAYLQDISSIKTEKEFEFLNTFPDSEISEGKTVTIFCEALGRSPPSVRMKRNGMTISESDGVYIASRRTNLWSTFYVTFLHASKEIEGNYSCVAESESRTAYQSYRVEVKPIVCWDLMIDFNVTDEVYYFFVAIRFWIVLSLRSLIQATFLLSLCQWRRKQIESRGLPY